MTLVILFPNASGKEGWATTSLKVRCGSAVMSNIEASEEELRECGMGILPGLSRFLETIWVFVVNTSHNGSLSSGVGVEEVEETARRDFLSDAAVAAAAVVLMWDRRAVEAFRSWGTVSIRRKASVGEHA